ncbi:ThiF family adenylyltransferase [Halobacillus yeomjeoni]|uniref:ThiF family adenylyltransferase n=1 Tax=Halobacillus yeomjeoni TaxID=311194 RepID=A0A931HYD7_9BACI|nr:ThiF family adenylyltransferase [Halobacillus yeomjeoni]MBH0231655.1 ThiF family adenylyltransferase [Halobacillus yeomjeoni]
MNDERYSRQRLFAPIGESGQERLKKSHILIVGMGALGACSAEQLVRAGIGKLTIIDRDYVEMSNLQRQQLYSENDAFEHLPKAVAAKKRLGKINASVEVEARVADCQKEQLEEIVPYVDLILDGTDNFETRLLINDASQKFKVPWIYGACVGSYGMSYTILPGKTPCLSCLLEQIPMGGATCDTAGVISPVVHMVAAHQVAESMKVLVDDRESLHHKFVTFDLWKHHYSAFKVSHAKRKTCSSCGESPAYPFLSESHRSKTVVLCGRETVQIRPSFGGKRDLLELKEKLPKEHVKYNSFLLTYHDGKHRMVFFADGRVLIHGTKDISKAKSLYHQVVG